MGSTGVVGELIVSNTSGADIGAAAGLAVGDGAEDTSVVEKLVATEAGHAYVGGIAHRATADSAADAGAIGNRESRVALGAHVVGTGCATSKRARDHTLSSYGVQSAVGADCAEVGLIA